ncbi:hypothetical protein MJO29_007093, partial [Puccinia striiformis f. sp. tritici]
KTEQREPTYITKYKEEFAFQLYQWYVEQGRYHKLLSQDLVSAPLITSFLDNMDYGKFLWIHDLAIDRFDHSSLVLLKEAESEKNLANQKVCRLLKVNYITVFCDTITSQNYTRWIEILTIWSWTTDWIFFRHNSNYLICANHAGDALKIEDLIEFYGLKANLEEQVEDSVITLDDIVPGRAQPALKSVWRRIYIHEDWQALKKSINLSDKDLSTCLKSTSLYHVLSSSINTNGTKNFGYSYVLTSSLPNLCLTLPNDPKNQPDSGKGELPISSSNESFFDPTISFNDNLAIRFPDHSLSELEQLSKDYQSGNCQLQEAIKSGNVWEFYSEIIV